MVSGLLNVAVSKGPAHPSVASHKDETLLAKGPPAKAFQKNISTTGHRTSPQWIEQGTQKDNQDSENAILVERWGSIQHDNTHHWHKNKQ